jgi:hypothetical protein
MNVKYIGMCDTDTEGEVFVKVEVIFEDYPPLCTGAYYNWRDDHIDLTIRSDLERWCNDFSISCSPELVQSVHREVLTAIAQHIEQHQIEQICASASADAQDLFKILTKDIVARIEDFEPLAERRFDPEKLKVPDNWETRSAYTQRFCDELYSLLKKATYADKGYDLGGHHLDLF